MSILKEELGKYDPIEVPKIDGFSKAEYTKNILLKFILLNDKKEKLSLLPILKTLIPFT